MKRIVLTTFFKAEHYGAVLQAYALQSVLQDKGFYVEILNYRDYAIENKCRPVKLKRNEFYSFLRACISFLLFYKKNKTRHKNFIQFQKLYLQIGKTEYWSVESIKENPPRADVYITGSDQVWNTEITKGISDVYTLHFGAENIQRISYAASIGGVQIRTEDEKALQEKLKKINSLSVREKTAKKALEKLLPEKTITVTLDPVLLRTKEKWEEDLTDLKKNKEKYILTYQIEENKEYKKTVNDLSLKTGLKVIDFKKWKRYANELYCAYTDGPLEFINLIRHAEYVITNSFHGTVFSIIFHKKFWVFPNCQTGSRITDLLDLLNISDRTIYAYDEFLLKKYNQNIDYERVDTILEKERAKSLEWLDLSLANRKF